MRITSLLIGIVLLAVALAGVSGAEAKEKPGKVRHVVAFKFKEGTSEAKITEVVEAFKALKGKISEIKTLECGVNNSPEKLNKGCTHIWILSFKNEKTRDAYLVHPDHKEFGKLVTPVIDDLFVADFTVTK